MTKWTLPHRRDAELRVRRILDVPRGLRLPENVTGLLDRLAAAFVLTEVHAKVERVSRCFLKGEATLNGFDRTGLRSETLPFGIRVRGMESDTSALAQASATIAAAVAGHSAFRRLAVSAGPEAWDALETAGLARKDAEVVEPTASSFGDLRLLLATFGKALLARRERIRPSRWRSVMTSGDRFRTLFAWDCKLAD